VEPSGWSQSINVDGFDQVAVQIPQGKTLSPAVTLTNVSQSDLRTMNVVLRVHIVRNAAVSSGLAVVVTSQTKMMLPSVQVREKVYEGMVWRGQLLLPSLHPMSTHTRRFLQSGVQGCFLTPVRAGRPADTVCGVPQTCSTTEAEAVALLGDFRGAKRGAGSGTTPGPEPLLCDRSPLFRIVNRSNHVIRCQQVSVSLPPTLILCLLQPA
jgi:hypothetical protein